MNTKDHETAEGESSTDAIIRRCGLDGYLFLRYLKTLLRIFILLAALVLPVLLPLNFTADGATRQADGLDRFSWTNVAPSRASLFWVHLMLSVLAVIWIWRVFWYEMHTLTRLRHRKMMGLKNGTAILVTDIPAEYDSVEKLKETYRDYLGGVKSVWLKHDYAQLGRMVEERDRLVLRLEQAETRLIRRAVSGHHKYGTEWWNRHATQRERCRLPPWGIKWLPGMFFFGQKVDLIDHYRYSLDRINKELQQQRSSVQQSGSGSAIVEFNEARAAHLASQAVHHPQPFLMRARYIEPSVNQIIWKNVSLSWKQQYVRMLGIGALMVVLCVCCIVPSAFTGLLSQLAYLATLWTWLDWLHAIPTWVQGILQGVLPAILLATISLILPMILERLILELGVQTDTAAELILQDYFFGFLFVQIFLVVSIAATIAAALSGLQSDLGLAATIAFGLPKASNYFLSYIMLQGLSVSAGALLQPGQLCRYILSLLRNGTPRESWEGQKQDVRWSTVYPVYTNLAVIGLVYSVVSPLILIVNVLAFALSLVVQHHKMRRISRSAVDTGGLVYYNAINHLFIGLYVMETYLALLFWLVRNEHNGVACPGQAIIMALLLLGTWFYQSLLNQAYRPLLDHLPVMLHGQAAGTLPMGGVCHGEQRMQVWDRLEFCNTLMGWPGEDVAARSDTLAPSGTADLMKALLCSTQPVVWLPNDKFNVSEDEIRQTIDRYDSIQISNRKAWMTRKGRVKCNGGPPECGSKCSEGIVKDGLSPADEGQARTFTWAHPLAKIGG